MRRVSLALVIALLAVPVSAQQQYLAFEQVTVAATSIGFTSALINPAGQVQANKAVCRVETAQMRFRIDGTAPTAAVGTILDVGDILTLVGNDVLRSFRAIRTGATSGVLSCSYTTPGAQP
ncbi:MAG TPA: hypothetical protein VNJ04_12035 [Gemmatimonadaceae bacterium]|nr:hypothetical protein [Gemmatimonadaceae bacterium]